MEDNEIIVPDTQSLKIGHKYYYIGKLSLKQTILLSRFIAKTILSSQGKLKALKEKTEGSKTEVEDIMSILDLLEEKDIFQLFGILLKEDDLSYLETNLDLNRSLEIIAIVCEQNSFESVKKNVMRIIVAVKPKEVTTH